MNILSIIVKMLSTKIKLLQVDKEAEDTYTFKFSIPKRTKWAPGAYAHFTNNDLSKGESLKKSDVLEFSIMSHPDENYLGFTTRIRERASDFKRGLLQLMPGDNIRLFKIGNHLQDKATDRPIVFISMGVGIATFRPLIIELQKSSRSFPLTNINIDRQANFIYAQELKALANKGLTNYFVGSRDLLYKTIDQHINYNHLFYIVGSKEFNKDIKVFLMKKDITEEAIILDQH